MTKPSNEHILIIVGGLALLIFLLYILKQSSSGAVSTTLGYTGNISPQQQQLDLSMAQEADQYAETMSSQATQALLTYTENQNNYALGVDQINAAVQEQAQNATEETSLAKIAANASLAQGNQQLAIAHTAASAEENLGAWSDIANFIPNVLKLFKL